MDRLFLQRISELSVAQLDRIVLRLSQEITSRKTKTSNSRTLDPQDFVNYEENFLNCTDVELLKGEVEQLKGQGRRKGKPHNTWISNTGLVYGWDGKSLEPHDLTNYPCVAATLKRINDEHGYNLNSCLVTYYPGEQGVGYHSDFELSLEDGAPIVVLSLGEPRKVDFNCFPSFGTPIIMGVTKTCDAVCRADTYEKCDTDRGVTDGEIEGVPIATVCLTTGLCGTMSPPAGSATQFVVCARFGVVRAVCRLDTAGAPPAPLRGTVVAFCQNVNMAFGYATPSLISTWIHPCPHLMVAMATKSVTVVTELFDCFPKQSLTVSRVKTAAPKKRAGCLMYFIVRF
eukprot:sb/3466369/